MAEAFKFVEGQSRATVLSASTIRGLPKQNACALLTPGVLLKDHSYRICFRIHKGSSRDIDFGVATAAHDLSLGLGRTKHSWAWHGYSGTRDHGGAKEGSLLKLTAKKEAQLVWVELSCERLRVTVDGKDVGELFLGFPPDVELFFAVCLFNSQDQVSYEDCVISGDKSFGFDKSHCLPCFVSKECITGLAKTNACALLSPALNPATGDEIEFKIHAGSSNDIDFGVATAAHELSRGLGSTKESWGWHGYSGTKEHGGVKDKVLTALKANKKKEQQVRVRFRKGSLEVDLNGASVGELFSKIVTSEPLYFAVCTWNSADVVSIVNKTPSSSSSESKVDAEEDEEEEEEESEEEVVTKKTSKKKPEKKKESAKKIETKAKKPKLDASSSSSSSSSSSFSSSLFESYPSMIPDPGEYLSPIDGILSRPSESLEEALSRLELPGLDFHAKNSLWFATQYLKKNPDSGLTRDEVAALNLYTHEWSTHSDSLYVHLNEALRNEDRGAVRPFFGVLRLLMRAMDKLPKETRTVFRGVKTASAIQSKYLKDMEMVWFPVTSCTTHLEVLSNPMFLGLTGHRTIFAIQCSTAVDIRSFSSVKSEAEVLLKPGVNLKVVGKLQLADGKDSLWQIQLQEVFSVVSIE